MTMRKTITPHHRIPRVVAIVALHGNCGHSIMRGVFSHIAQTSEWGLEIIRSPDMFTVETIRQAVAHNVDGMIISLASWPPRTLEALTAADIPFVTIDMQMPVSSRTRSHCVNIALDNAGIGRIAAADFANQGRYASYAFVSTKVREEWSDLRQSGFLAEIKRIGRSAFAFADDESNDTITRRGNLAKWLRRLPKPAAVFAADDSVAIEVINAAAAAHISIPRELAVLGVDNDVFLCENAKPTLSSILPDFVGSGLLAARTLQSIIDTGRVPQRGKTIVHPTTSEIIRRQSTTHHYQAGTLVQLVLGFIADQAATGISADDIARHFCISRSHLDHCIREIADTTVQTLIIDARLKELKRLLRTTDKPIEEITRQLGWNSPNYPKNLFKRTYGMSMRDWRNSTGLG